jgi:hypothetical protein
MSLLMTIVNVIPVTDVPELVVQYLLGDDCLDDTTISQVFPKPYLSRNGNTYLNRELTVLHSFDDKPAINFSVKFEWYRNGKLHRKDLPAVLTNEINSNDTRFAAWIENKKILGYADYLYEIEMHDQKELQPFGLFRVVRIGKICRKNTFQKWCQDFDIIHFY